MSKPMKIMIIGLVVVFGGIFAWNTFISIIIKRAISNLSVPTMTISAIQAEEQTWHPYLSTVGTITAVNGVNISTELAGIVADIHFQSGQEVKKGDLLVTLRDETDQADLENLRAALRLAQLNYDRQEDLFKHQVITAADLDAAEAELDQKSAQLNRVEAIIEQKRITAPFDGHLGIRQINIGEYVNPGDIFVALQALDTLFVEFSIPGNYLLYLYNGQPIEFTTTSLSNDIFTAEITAINSEVDINSRNILVQATINSPSDILLPGVFVDVKVTLPQRNNVVTVPETAVAYSLYGQSVFVIEEIVDEDKDETIKIANRRYVTTGERRDNQVAILDGLTAGEWVVTSGQHKLGEGNVPVAINNSVTLD